jgi:hypothetical protein
MATWTRRRSAQCIFECSLEQSILHLYTPRPYIAGSWMQREADAVP